jgi:hypothetical protein
MRARILCSTLAILGALAGCSSSGGGTQTGSGGTPSTGGYNGSGGSGDGGSGSGGNEATGGTTGSGGSPGTGGAISTGGTSASGGTGGHINTGGSVGTGGTSATGGTTGAGGTGTGGTIHTGGTTGAGGTAGGGGTSSGTGGGTGGTTVAYQGPCDLVASGCAEAYGLTRAMTSKYTGPLFQLGLAKDKTKLLDIGQTSDHKADMTTWSAFCSASQSNCVVSKIYAQIHSGPNDLVPGVFNTPWKPDCSAGGFTCAAKFTIESATGLPILTTDSPAEYTLSNDNFATGINGGGKAMGIMYNGKPVANATYCCGVIGLTHKYNATDTTGTDFMLALAYGWRDANGCCIATNCGKSNTYCVGAEEEENNDLYDYGTTPLDNAFVVTQFDPTPNAVITYLNGTKVLTHSPPKAKLNAGTAVHLGGGGDLSQPDSVRMREAFFTNTVMSDSEVTAMKANIAAFFPALKF